MLSPSHLRHTHNNNSIHTRRLPHFKVFFFQRLLKRSVKEPQITPTLYTSCINSILQKVKNIYLPSLWSGKTCLFMSDLQWLTWFPFTCNAILNLSTIKNIKYETKKGAKVRLLIKNIFYWNVKNFVLLSALKWNI